MSGQGGVYTRRLAGDRAPAIPTVPSRKTKKKVPRPPQRPTKRVKNERKERFITLEVNPVGDLFVPGTEYIVKTALGTVKRFGPFTDDNQVRRDRIIRREVMETIYHMVNTRTNENVMGYLNEEQRKKVRTLEVKAKAAGNINEGDGLFSFFRYINDHVMPALWDVRPGQGSRYHKNYMIRWTGLDGFIKTLPPVAQHA